MSHDALFVRHQRRLTDDAIGKVYSRCLKGEPSLAAFEKLLSVVRRVARALLSAPPVQGRHLGVTALANLSRFSDRFVRDPETWGGLGKPAGGDRLARAASVRPLPHAALPRQGLVCRR